MITTHPGDTVRQRLEVELDIVPPDRCRCTADDFGDEVVDVQQVRVDDDHYADLTVPSSEQCCPDDESGCVIHRENRVGAECPFRAFYDEGWVPRVLRVTDESIRVQTYLPDRDALSDVIDGLEATADAFQVRQLTQVELDEDGTSTPSTSLDLTGLTEKQRTAAVRAVEAGYYETPRETSFGSLADSMGVSKSVLSRRLNAVEARVMKAAFTGMTASAPS